MNGAGQTPMPMHPGRGHREIAYDPQHHGPFPPHPYNQHPPQYRQYYQQPPQQWAYYPNMQPGLQHMHRPYPHQFQTMMPIHYQMPQAPQMPPHSMSPRPGQHIPQYHPMRPVHNFEPYPPPPTPSRAMHPSPFIPTEPIYETTYPLEGNIHYDSKLPWQTNPSDTFTPADVRTKRRVVDLPLDQPVQLPEPPVIAEDFPEEQTLEAELTAENEIQSAILPAEESTADASIATLLASTKLSEQASSARLEVSTLETPSTSQAPSENNSTQPTTPSSTQPPRSTSSSGTIRPASKRNPVIPAVPYFPSKPRRQESSSTIGDTTQSTASREHDGKSSVSEATPPANEAESAELTTEEEQLQSVVHAPPKSWADLVRSKATAAQTQNTVVIGAEPSQINGSSDRSSLADVLKNFSMQQPTEDIKLAFTKPRGLVNTGNMCYMNAVLQVLLYCTPLYGLLRKISKNSSHSFKSETPMLDAMILFFREFPIIDAAESAEKLQLRLKNEELEQYGEPFTPEFVYEVIRRLPRFASMRRGHQQDAEEFLGFLLEEMHEECVACIKRNSDVSDELVSPITETSLAEDDWQEVGRKQKAAVTRTSGYSNTESPITKIFGGNLRSEFRVPGVKNSVTFEPYQPLQLDIGSPQVNNIIDALKNLTRPETIQGDFNSPRGPGVGGKKQYDNAGGTQKIWKKVGYPLELEIPKEVFPQHKRGGFAVKGGLPKYRLISVVYHHGKSASGGHYTVDVRRQDGTEWIRLDDTVIRRVRKEDVAEGGSEEDPKILAEALERHKRDQSNSSNIFDQVREEHEETAEAEKGWSHVNGSSHGGSTSKKWSAIANGTATPTLSSGKRTPNNKYSSKDNKVAYILFYQRIQI